MRKQIILIIIVITLCINVVSAAVNTNNIVWKPFPMKNSWQNSNNKIGGEGMQMVYDIDWNTKNTNVLYLVTDTTKVWKSSDRGDSWKQVGKNLKLKGATSVVSDPNNADIVFIAASRVSTSTLDSDEEGIYRSLNGGLDWTQVGNTLHYINTKHGKLFLFDSGSSDGTHSKIIYGGGPNGVLKSFNGGDSWSAFALTGEYVYDLEWSADKKSIFASSETGLYRIEPINNSITKIGSGLSSHPWDIAIDVKNASIIYAATSNGIYKSTDGGIKFIMKSNGLDTSVSYNRVTISNTDTSKLFASPNMLAGVFPYYSMNGGEIWQKTADANAEEFLSQGYYYAEPVIFDPNNSSIAIMQRDSAIAKTFDSGSSWHFSSNGFTGARMQDIDFINATSMLFCLYDYGLFITNNNGKSFSSLDIPRVDGSISCGAIDSNGATIIASSGKWSNQDLIKSTDYGNTWVIIQQTSESFDFIKFNPSNNRIIYADTFYSLDGGNTWKNTGNGFEIRAIDPFDSSIIYGMKYLGSSVQIAESRDNGATWSNIGSALETQQAFDLDVDPYSRELHLLVSVNTGVYEYKNKVWTFNGENEGLPPYGANYVFVRFDPNRPGIVWTGQQGYRFHGSGVYLSEDGGTTWSNQIKNLGPYNDVFSIEINPYDSTVYLTGPGILTTKLENQTQNISNPICGDKICNGKENCSTCNADCGTCPLPPVCGDGTCNGNENCSSCSADCGICPLPKITGCVLKDVSWDENSMLKRVYDLKTCFRDPLNTTLRYSVRGNKAITVTINNGLVDLSAPTNWSGVEHVVFYATSGNRSATTNNITLTVNNVPDCGVCPTPEPPRRSGGGGGGGGGLVSYVPPKKNQTTNNNTNPETNNPIKNNTKTINEMTAAQVTNATNNETNSIMKQEPVMQDKVNNEPEVNEPNSQITGSVFRESSKQSSFVWLIYVVFMIIILGYLGAYVLKKTSKRITVINDDSHEPISYDEPSQQASLISTSNTLPEETVTSITETEPVDLVVKAIQDLGYDIQYATQLHTYVKKALSIGYSWDKITNSLLSVGWAENVVDSLTKYYASQAQTVAPPLPSFELSSNGN